MHFRNDQNVNRGLRRDIAKRQNRLVVEDHIAGDLAISNLAEQTIAHGATLAEGLVLPPPSCASHDDTRGRDTRR